MLEPNPYQPPEARPDPARRPARNPLAALLRAVAVVAGFALLADPFVGVIADNRIRIMAKFLGAGLMFAAFYPFGRPGRVGADLEPTAEDL